MEKKRLEEKAELKEIPIVKINPGKRVRRDFDREKLDDLKKSIERNGLIHPIAVMSYGTSWQGYDYFLLAGERRMRSFKELGKETIPARVYPPDLSAYEIKCIELEENLFRQDLTPAEELLAKKAAYEARIALYGAAQKGSKEGMSIEEFSKLIGESKTNTARDLKLAEWVERYPKLAEGAKTKADIKRRIDNIEGKLETKLRLQEIQEEKKEILQQIKQDKAEGVETIEKEKELQEKKLLCDLYIVGDFFDVVKDIPDESIDFIDCDIDYPIERSNGRLYKAIIEDQRVGDYTSISEEDFPKVFQKAIKECYRILKPDRWAIFWFGYENFQRVQSWLEHYGFRTMYYHGKWFKGKGRGSTTSPLYILGHTIVPFFYARKGSPKLAKAHDDVFECPPVPPAKKIHPYERPIKLMKEILETFCEPGYKVVVPFAGSGNTLIAAHQINCLATGVDTSQAYKDKYVVKVMSGNWED